MLFRSRSLLPLGGRDPVHDGALVTRGDRILAAGPWVDVRREFGSEPVTDLGEQVILPGLINAHCHLDYSSMRGAIGPQRTFTAWIGHINALKRELSDDDTLAAIASGYRECARHGTTTVLNVEAFPELMLRMPRPPLRTWWFLEMIDLRGRIATEELVAGMLSFFEQRPDWPGGFGLSPHAPYTASADLYRLTRDCSRRTGMPWTTHLNESVDEWEMFTARGGPLFDFLAKLGRPMEDCGGGRSALGALAAVGALGPECLAVHLNQLTESDFALLAPGRPLHGLTVVHCPLSHHYFGHAPFPLARLRANGVNLCVGTDSLASNGSLNLLAELRTLAASPEGAALSPAQLLATVTVNPARALNLGNRLGLLAPGAWADWIALPDDGVAPRDLSLGVLLYRRPVTCVVVAGVSVSGDASDARNFALK